jgi:hypothetical protein
MVKGIGLLALLLFVGGYVAGAFGPKNYSRVVGRPEVDVVRALEHLDVTAQPGSPGTDPAASGGIKPLFRLEQAPGRMTWYVMSGDKVATRMIATLEPIDSGRQTRVSTAVERGDAPDDFVSPAFRSKGLTMALFGMAIESELNKLVAPPAADPVTCRDALDRFTDANIAGGSLDRPGNLTQAVGAQAQMVMRLHAEEAELRRIGCSTDNGGAFRPVESQMRPAEPARDSSPLPGTPSR